MGEKDEKSTYNRSKWIYWQEPLLRLNQFGRPKTFVEKGCSNQNGITGRKIILNGIIRMRH